MMRTVPPPSIVPLLPPSITVSAVVLSESVLVTVITALALPQLNVITPALPIAVVNAASLQLAASPVPTTVVGFDESAAIASLGNACEHLPSGLPALPTTGTDASEVDASDDIVEASFFVPPSLGPAPPRPAVADPLLPPTAAGPAPAFAAAPVPACTCSAVP